VAWVKQQERSGKKGVMIFQEMAKIEGGDE
jgi:hypothetical protein